MAQPMDNHTVFLQRRIAFLMNKFTKYIEADSIKCSICNEINTRKVLLFSDDQVRLLGFLNVLSKVSDIGCHAICISCMSK
jgi:hypothetical protein